MTHNHLGYIIDNRLSNNEDLPKMANKMADYPEKMS